MLTVTIIAVPNLFDFSVVGHLDSLVFATILNNTVIFITKIFILRTNSYKWNF